MITVTLVLKVGNMKHGVFESYDEYDLEDEEDVNSILNVVADPAGDRAVLLIHVTGWPDAGRTLASFKKVKVTTKKGVQYRWNVVE
jgi:hypothetical protein